MRKKNEAENAKKLKENQNGNQSVSSEEQPADNVIINELEEPKTSFETEEVNGNISVATISEKFEEVALESVEEEAEGNLGKVSDSSLTKTLTNGDLPNGSATAGNSNTNCAWGTGIFQGGSGRPREIIFSKECSRS